MVHCRKASPGGGRGSGPGNGHGKGDRKMGEKKRLVTRSDFDGLVCAMILRELDLIDDIKFVHPKDVQDGKVELSENDITTNLPFDPRVGLSSEIQIRKFYTDYDLRDECMSMATTSGRATSSTLIIYGEMCRAGGEYPLDFRAIMANPAEYGCVTDSLNGEPRYADKTNA